MVKRKDNLQLFEEACEELTLEETNALRCYFVGALAASVPTEKWKRALRISGELLGEARLLAVKYHVKRLWREAETQHKEGGVK